MIFAAIVSGMLASGTVRATPPSAPVVIRALTVDEFRSELDGARGHVLVVNVWASWCAPCLREIPALAWDIPLALWLRSLGRLRPG